MTEEVENPITPDADDIESAAPAELTFDIDDCEEIEVDWFIFVENESYVLIQLSRKMSNFEISPPFE